MEQEFAGAPETVATLLTALGGANGAGRHSAKSELVRMGTVVTGHMIAAATSSNAVLRLEATQVLADIADPRSAKALADRFQDTFEIGWAAARGLSKMGREGALAALHELIQHPGVQGVRVSAHHALRDMRDSEVHKKVAPVVAALADSAPADQAPVAALEALRQLGR